MAAEDDHTVDGDVVGTQTLEKPLLAEHADLLVQVAVQIQAGCRRDKRLDLPTNVGEGVFGDIALV